MDRIDKWFFRGVSALLAICLITMMVTNINREVKHNRYQEQRSAVVQQQIDAINKASDKLDGIRQHKHCGDGQ